jgi:hypothetical protein
MPSPRRLSLTGVIRVLSVLAAVSAAGTAPRSAAAQSTAANGAAGGERKEQAQAQAQVLRTSAEAPPVENVVTNRATGAEQYRPVTIRLDNTGVASWKYRNARNPPRVWDRAKPAPQDFKLGFANGTSGATVKVTFPQVAVPFVPERAAQPPQPRVPELNPSSLLGFDADGARAEARRLVNLALTYADDATAHSGEESAYVIRLPREEDTYITTLASYLKVQAQCTDRKLTDLIEKRNPKAGEAATVPAVTPKDLEASAWSLRKNAQMLLGQPVSSPPAALAGEVAPDCAQSDLLVTRRKQLAKFRADYPARAGARAPLALAAGFDALEQAASAITEYIELPDPSSTPPPPPPPGAPVRLTPMDVAQRAFGVKLDACEAKNGEVFCTPTLTLAPNADGWIDGRLLAKYPAKVVIKFRVTFPFALETEQPSDQFGYFTIDKELQQSPNVALWSASGSISLMRDPFYGPDSVVLDSDYVYDGARTRQVRGTARTALAFSLGDRASGTIDLQFKNAALGRKDEDLAVKANQYNFQVFGFSGTSLKFGKYLFAAPTEGLAINETGEGATVRYRWLGVSHILRRESQAGAADPDDDDHKVWLGDISNVAVPGWSSLRSLSFYGLYGIDNTPGRHRRYDTVGGEASFGLPAVLLTGTVGYYHSRSRPEDGSPVRDAEGSSWLTRVSRSWFQNSKPARTVALTVAGASGDRRDTSDKFEGYLGENAAYAPDGSLFLSGIAPRLRIAGDPLVMVDQEGNPLLDKNGNTTPEFLEKGLSNRRFAGGTYTDQTFSPLEWLAALLQIPQKDVESRQSTFRVHYYSPAEQILGTRVGTWEMQAEFLLESPKGIKYIVKYSRVFAGGPLEGLFPKEPYALIAQCNVSLK